MTAAEKPSPILLSAEGIRKRFGAIEALRGVDLTVRAGQWLGLLGPNGAGKTTLMQIIVGLVQADGGKMILHGESIDPCLRRRTPPCIGFVPQEIALYPALTARENLALFASFHGVSRQDRSARVEWALDWTGLADRQHQRIATFSGGMKRRLNIACGVLHEPDLVVLDEPTVGVDPHARQHIWEMLDGLRQRGVSLLHSSHQLDEIESTCDHVFIIDHGLKVAQGHVHELLGQQRHTTRRLTMRLSAAPPADAFVEPFIVRGSVVCGTIEDPARSLDQILNTIRTLDLELLEIRVETPRLEDVFAQLTGRELRD